MANHPSNSFAAYRRGPLTGTIMRCAGALVAAVLLLAGPLAAAPGRAETGVCADNALPVEVPGNSRAQVEALIKQGLACARQGKHAPAISFFSEAIRHDPMSAAAYLNRGSVQASVGEVVLAIGDYNTAISLKPDLVEAWYNRGIADFTEALRLKPDFALAYCNRGVANFELGRYDDALVDYSVAIDHDAKLSYCYFSRGSPVSHARRVSEGGERPYHRARRPFRRCHCLEPQGAGL
jgi:tetratricopeptide (TPR) repeat protein